MTLLPLERQGDRSTPAAYACLIKEPTLIPSPLALYQFQVVSNAASVVHALPRRDQSSASWRASGQPSRPASATAQSVFRQPSYGSLVRLSIASKHALITADMSAGRSLSNHLLLSIPTPRALSRGNEANLADMKGAPVVLLSKPSAWPPRPGSLTFAPSSGTHLSKNSVITSSVTGASSSRGTVSGPSPPCQSYFAPSSCTPWATRNCPCPSISSLFPFSVPIAVFFGTHPAGR
jgi:hypothetical protein